MKASARPKKEGEFQFFRAPFLPPPKKKLTKFGKDDFVTKAGGVSSLAN